jgi:hypothetical protein
MDNNYKSITNNNNKPTVMDRELSMARDRGKWLKIQPVVYRWMSRAGWVIPTSNEVMKMNAINHKPMIILSETLPFRVGGGQMNSLYCFKVYNGSSG